MKDRLSFWAGEVQTAVLRTRTLRQQMSIHTINSIFFVCVKDDMKKLTSPTEGSVTAP